MRPGFFFPNENLSLYNAEPAELLRELSYISTLVEGCLAFEIARLAGLYKYYNLVQSGSGASAPLTTIQDCIELILGAAELILAKLDNSSHIELIGSMEAIRAEMSKQGDLSSSTIATGHFLQKETALLFVGAMDQAYLIFEPAIKAARNRSSRVALCMDILELSTDRLTHNGEDLIRGSYAALEELEALAALGTLERPPQILPEERAVVPVCESCVVGVEGRGQSDSFDLECQEDINDFVAPPDYSKKYTPRVKRVRFTLPENLVQTVRTPTPTPDTSLTPTM